MPRFQAPPGSQIISEPFRKTHSDGELGHLDGAKSSIPHISQIDRHLSLDGVLVTWDTHLSEIIDLYA